MLEHCACEKSCPTFCLGTGWWPHTPWAGATFVSHQRLNEGLNPVCAANMRGHPLSVMHRLKEAVVSHFVWTTNSNKDSKKNGARPVRCPRLVQLPTKPCIAVSNAAAGAGSPFGARGSSGFQRGSLKAWSPCVACNMRITALHIGHWSCHPQLILSASLGLSELGRSSHHICTKRRPIGPFLMSIA